MKEYENPEYPVGSIHEIEGTIIGVRISPRGRLLMDISFDPEPEKASPEHELKNVCVNFPIDEINFVEPVERPQLFNHIFLKAEILEPRCPGIRFSIGPRDSVWFSPEEFHRIKKAPTEAPRP